MYRPGSVTEEGEGAAWPPLVAEGKARAGAAAAGGIALMVATATATAAAEAAEVEGGISAAGAAGFLC